MKVRTVQVKQSRWYILELTVTPAPVTYVPPPALRSQQRL